MSPPVITSPSITTTAGGLVVLGSGMPLTDSATLAGGNAPTGTITFTLTAPNGTTVDAETVPVTGDGTYLTPKGYVPSGVGTLTGTYEWQASYSGDANNMAVASPPGSEPENVNPASPMITTAAGGTVTLGSGLPLTDSATLSQGAFYLPGSGLTFTLTAPSGATVDTETVPVTGNGTYDTPKGYVPSGMGTLTGSYEWQASFSGDANNMAVTSPAGSEPETVDPASPMLTTTPGATVMLGSNDPLTDSATLSGGAFYLTGGTLTFTLLGPGGAAVHMETVPVTDNGTYGTSKNYVPSGVGILTGTYQWEVSYSGDANNKQATSPTGSEPETVDAASPTITTTAGGTVVIGSGIPLTDSATLADDFNPTGTITFTLTDPNGAMVDTEPAQISVNGTASTSMGYLPSIPGTYEWVAIYSGDGNNKAVSSTLGDEPEMAVLVLVQPTITTSAGPDVVVGSGLPLTDSATLAGGLGPTGTITFTLTAPGGAVVDTETVDVVNGNSTYSTRMGYVPHGAGTLTGTYEWQASYSGDARNLPVSSVPGSEPETVSPASPTITTTAGGAVVLGSSVPLTDSATLAGGFNPTGTITFTLFAPNGAAVDTEMAPVNAKGVSSTPMGYLPTATGTYQWVASYGGDGNNNPVSGKQGDEPEMVTSNKASPTLNTTAGPGVVVGNRQALTDAATLAGGKNPTGTITFTLTAPGGGIVDTEIVQVNHGNGVYTTPQGYAPAGKGVLTGAYQWVAIYSGDPNNNAANDQGGAAEQAVVSKANPTLKTKASPAITLHANIPTLSDTAVLAGGFSASGFIVFTLNLGAVPVFTTQDMVNGNATYTASHKLPAMGTVTGTYTWSVSYQGDGNNNAASDQGGAAEQTVVNPASPKINTTAGPAVVLGSGMAITDSAALTGGYNPTGTITFTLLSPAGAVMDLEMTNVSGNGVYATPRGYVPNGPGTLTGLYHWVVNYTGDGNNHTASPLNREAERVNPASPHITTTAGPSVVVGTRLAATDSAALVQGYNPSGTLTFTLLAPDGATIYTQPDNVNGNNVYTASYTPAPGTGTGTYQWVVSYSGDSNNHTSTSRKGDEPIILIGPGVSIIGTELYFVGAGGGGSHDVQIQATPLGTSNTGSTGIHVMSTIGGVTSVKGYTQTFTAFRIYDFGGNDDIQFTPSISINTFATLGNGNNVVVAGDGNNTLTAGNGDNLIAAGLGQNTVMLGNGSNILIDGTVQLIRGGDSLRQVLDDWASKGATAANVSSIRSRLAVTDNTSHANTLLAGTGLDWFWEAFAGDTTNRKATDLLN